MGLPRERWPRGQGEVDRVDRQGVRALVHARLGHHEVLLEGARAHNTPPSCHDVHVIRTIIALHQDAEAHWVARIDCGHAQHMRHQPPLISRPWVLTEEKRAGRIGMDIDCPLCDRAEMPADYTEYRRTPVFDASTVPKALLREHRTKVGVWGILHVVAGEVDYVVLEPERRVTTLRAGAAQVVTSALPHEVVLREGARFFVAFYGPPAA